MIYCPWLQSSAIVTQGTIETMLTFLRNKHDLFPLDFNIQSDILKMQDDNWIKIKYNHNFNHKTVIQWLPW